MDYITQPKDYWLAPNAINITLNALDNPNRIQASVASGAVVSCYIEGIEGLGLDNGRNPKRWPLTISPTYFNSNTEKYIYVAIPRSEDVGTQAVVVFPSEKLDIYGKNVEGDQVGSLEHYYVWLQGILSASGESGDVDRVWTAEMDFGKLGTYEDIIDMTETDWYSYSKVLGVVTFLKSIVMKAGETFHNLILGNKELTGVATAATSDDYIDSETLVATPSYIHTHYLSKKHEDTAEEQIGFLKGLWFGVKGLYEITAEGVGKFKSLFADDITTQRMQVDTMQSSNYTGDGLTDAGWRLTKDSNGRSKLTIDELYVRMKAVFESLEVKKEMVTGGNQIFSRAANVISRTDYYNSSNQKIGYSEVKVPWLLRGLSMVLSKNMLSGIYSKVKTVRVVISDPTDIAYIRCYFLAEEGGRKVNNLWSITDGHDLARCQTFNLNRSERQTYVDGADVKLGNVFWWRKVVGVSSNSSPVEIDGKKYHYFDVSNQSGGYMGGSDLPCAGDEVSQWGNDANPDRMNLVTIEVDGTDSPAIKAYMGIYTFDMSKSWWGGSPRKMMLSPKQGYELYGPSFRLVQEYGEKPVSVDRGNWSDIATERDDYAPHGQVRKLYYYDNVSHAGCYWLCVMSGTGAHWVDSNGDYISDADYGALTDEQKATCSRKQNYITDEPSTSSANWQKQVDKGQNGIDAQDVEWAYIRSKTNVAPIILSDNTYTDSNGNGYTADEHLPHVTGSADIENNEGAYECTDDPKGVNETWKYEWEIKRSKGAASDGHRTWNYYQGSMTLHGNFAESAFIIDTDNDNDQFGTDSDSKVLVTQVRKTTVALYDGATPQTLTALSATLTYEDGTSVPSGVATVTATAATGVVEVTVLQNNTANTHSEIRASITATCAKGSKQTTFTVRKVMSGQPGLSPTIFRLNPTNKDFVFNRDASNNLTPSSRSTTVNAQKTIGNTTTDATLADNLTFTWGFDDSATAEGSGAIGNSSSNTISVTNTQAGSHYQVWILLSTGDRETLPIVKDGAKGNDGTSVEARYAPNSNPTSSQIHTTFQTGDKYISTRTTGSTWSSWQKFVGENGAETDWTFAISQYKTTTNVQTAPSDISSWSGEPVQTTSQKPYLWAKIEQKNSAGTTVSTSYIRLTGEAGASAYSFGLDNMMDSVAVNASGHPVADTTLLTNMKVYKGSTEIAVVAISIVDDANHTWANNSQQSGNNTVDNIKVTWDFQNAYLSFLFYTTATISGTRHFTITLKASDNTIQDVVFTVNGQKGGKDAVIYNLKPSQSSVNCSRTDAGAYDPSTYTLTCGYTKNVGGTMTTVNDVTGQIDGTYNIYYRKRTRSTKAWQNLFYRYYTYKASSSVAYTLKDVNPASYDAVEFILCTATDDVFAQSDLTNYDVIDRQTIPVVSDGVKGAQGLQGPRGKLGRFFYYAGIFDATDNTTEFEVNDGNAPYFKHGANVNQYSVWNPETSPASGKMTMKAMWDASGSWSSGSWEVMTNIFKYLITQALFADYADFGSSIINGDWMFSKYGTVYGRIIDAEDPDYGNIVTFPVDNGAAAGHLNCESTFTNATIGVTTAKYPYQLFNGKFPWQNYIEDPYPLFVPNWLVNFKTGEMITGGGKMIMSNGGAVTRAGLQHSDIRIITKENFAQFFNVNSYSQASFDNLGNVIRFEHVPSAGWYFRLPFFTSVESSCGLHTGDVNIFQTKDMVRSYIGTKITIYNQASDPANYITVYQGSANINLREYAYGSNSWEDVQFFGQGVGGTIDVGSFKVFECVVAMEYLGGGRYQEAVVWKQVASGYIYPDN